jgi:multiple sugar transport system permease protein
MIFSPTTERSLPVRSLYAAIYGFLILGAVTMIVPFIIMATGSVEPRAQATDGMFFPAYLTDREVLWDRYLETKYHGLDEFLRSSWNVPDATFAEAAASDPPDSGTDPALWKRFLQETQPPTRLFAAAFLRPNARMPSTNAFAFREWLFARHGSLEGINKALEAEFPAPTQIRPPFIRFDGAPLPSTPLVRAFEEFLATLPDSRRFAWNVGGYYRTSVLPRLVGPLIEDYNSKFGTDFSSFAEVPFPSTVPETGADPWFFFTSQLLRPDFIALTPSGEKRRAELGLEREDFIRSQAVPTDLRIVSADTLFADWAALQGIANARIPQPQLDRADFEAESGFWRNQFLTLNYRLVLDEILINGPAIRNTFLLVLLSVGGALLVNPLAAYALSRYKMRSSFHILLFFLATIAFPAEVTMIPVFLQLKEFNLLNTFGALVLPGLANGFSIFLLKGFFDSLPRELYEAAELDGAGEWTMFWTVTMNLSKPILAVIALGAFVNAYGTFFYALILAPDPKMWTIMVYVYQLRQAVDPPVVYASLLITAIPTMIIFVTCQNIILRGIVVPSEK